MPWVPSAGTSHSYALEVNGDDVLRHVPLDHEPVRWEDEAGNSVATMTWVVEDRNAWADRIPLDIGAHVQLRDNTTDTVLFGGTLVRRTDSPGITGRWSECEAVSYESWLDWRIVPRWSNLEDTAGRNRKLVTDRACVQDVMERRCAMIHTPASTVDKTTDTMPPLRLQKVTVREVLEAIADRAQTTSDPQPRRWYVSTARNLHWYKGSEGNAAPVSLNVTGAGGTIVPEDLSVEYDRSEPVHHVYILGSNREGSGWVYNVGSDFQLGAAQQFLERPHVDKENERNRVGRAWLRRHGRVVSGRFTTTEATGWRAGQLLTVTHPQLGLSADTYEVRRVSGELRPGDYVHHDIEFGAIRRSLLREVRRRR